MASGLTFVKGMRDIERETRLKYSQPAPSFVRLTRHWKISSNSKMYRRLFALLLLWCSTGLLSAAVEQTMWKSLTSQQQALLSGGNPLVIEENAGDNPWPRYVVYRVIGSSAERTAAVFWDCELDNQYVPNCVSVRTVSHPQPGVVNAEYTLKMPMFLPDEVYISQNELRSPSPGTFEISWKVLHARYISGSTGSIRVEPLVIPGLAGPRSLMRYSNLVLPGGKIAGLLKSQARSEVIDSVNALARQVEQESSQLACRQISEMNKALAGTPSH